MAAEVPIIIPKTDADVEMLVKAVLEFDPTNNEDAVRKGIEMCRQVKCHYLRPFTREEMARRDVIGPGR